MAYQIEAKPQLISRDYWGGVDIDRPEDFTSPLHREEFSMGGLISQIRLQKAFMDGIAAIAIAQGGDEEIAYTQWFSPTKAELPDRSLIIIEREALVAGDEARPDLLNAVAEHSAATKSLPISRPFVANWANAQASGFESCGEEYAFFPEQDILYLRSLLWGVTASRGAKRGVVTWQFADAKIEHTDGGLVTVSEPDELAELLPLSIGVSHAGMVDLDGERVRCIERNRSIQVVREDITGGAKFSGGRERLRTLREKVQAALAAPEHAGPVTA